MFSLLASLWAKDKADEAARYAAQIQKTVETRVVTPLYDGATRAANTVHDWAIPVRPPTEAEKSLWKREADLIPFQNNDSIELYALFENAEERKSFGQKHLFCALHHPGLALDLCVLFNIPVDEEHKKYLLNHYVYSDWQGSPRDRLLNHLESAMNRFVHPFPNQTYESFIRTTLYNRGSLLYQVLADHRYTYSPSAVMGRPDTLTQLNQILRDKEASRLRACRYAHTSGAFP